VSGVVSTIIPVRNRARLLREAVASVVAQTYGAWEIVIVDDESTDETPDTIAELCASDARIRSVSRANGGPGLARETGRNHATGEFIQYLDSDDLLLPRKFELQVAALRAKPECGAAYGIVRYRNAGGEEIVCDWKTANQVQETLFPSLLTARWWETVSPMWRRSTTDAIGAWTSMRLEEDWEYDARAAALGIRLAFVNEVVAEHRDHGDARLSRGSGLDPARLRDRARAHELIAEHARGVPRDAPEMRQFGRELFHIARQCGAAGLGEESRRLVALAREIEDTPDLRVYSHVAKLIGWTRAAKLAMRVRG